jgi:hypothetical protein
MANVNKPFGLAVVRTLSGGQFSEQGTRYWIPSTDNNAYYIGDLVISLANADGNGVSGVVKATAGTETYRGVIAGVEVANVGGVSIQGTPLALETTNIPATKLRDYYVYVQDDPMTLFSCQGDLTATNQIAANANKNCNFTIAAGASTVSCSGTVIASASIATTNTFSGKLMGLLQIPGNGFGAFAVWNVKLNAHEFNGLTAGV